MVSEVTLINTNAGRAALIASFTVFYAHGGGGLLCVLQGINILNIHHNILDRNYWYTVCVILFVSHQVFIITLIGDIKFQHFNPVLETYINKHFSATLAYMWVSVLRFTPSIASLWPADLDAWLVYLLRKLTRVLNYYVGHAEQPVLTERLYSALKALKYLFRFIVQSRVLYLRYQRSRCYTSIDVSYFLGWLWFNAWPRFSDSTGTARTETLSSTPFALCSCLSTLSWTGRWTRGWR